MRSVIVCGLILSIMASILNTEKYAYARDEYTLVGLDESLQIAKSGNLDYKKSQKKMKASKEKVNQMWGRLYPILESEGSMIRQGAKSGLYSLTDGQYDIKIVQMRFGINPGIFYNSLMVSRDAYRASVEEVRKVRMEIEQQVIKSYFDLILAEEVIALRKDSIKMLEENVRDVQNQYRNGTIPRYDLLQAQVRLQSAEPFLIDAENKYRVALELFNYHLGFDEKKYRADRHILDETLLRSVDPDIDARVEVLGKAALQNRPEIIQVELKKELTRHTMGISRSQYLWPTFTVGGYFGYNKALTGDTGKYIISPSGPMYFNMSNIVGSGKWEPNWQVRVAATYRWGSLLPVDSAQAEVREAKILLKEAEDEITKIKRLVVISLKSSYSNLYTSYKTIHSQKENINKSEEGLRIARESYKAGIIKNTDLLAAQVAVTEARMGYVNALYGYYVALSQLRKEIGTEDDTLIFGGLR